MEVALAKWLSWLERHSLRHKVADWIPHQDTYLGCVFDPGGGTHRKQPIVT